MQTATLLNHNCNLPFYIKFIIFQTSYSVNYNTFEYYIAMVSSLFMLEAN